VGSFRLQGLAAEKEVAYGDPRSALHDRYQAMRSTRDALNGRLSAGVPSAVYPGQFPLETNAGFSVGSLTVALGKKTCIGFM